MYSCLYNRKTPGKHASTKGTAWVKAMAREGPVEIQRICREFRAFCQQQLRFLEALYHFPLIGSSHRVGQHSVGSLPID